MLSDPADGVGNAGVTVYVMPVQLVHVTGNVTAALLSTTGAVIVPTEIVGCEGAVTVTIALADTPQAETVTVTVPAEDGAVNMPELILPAEALQFTASLQFWSELVNNCVAPVITDALVGEIEIEGCCCCWTGVDPPLQLRRKMRGAMTTT